MFESILNNFHLRFKDRMWAGNVLGESLKDLLKKENKVNVIGIPRGGVVTADAVARKIDANFDIISYAR
jgi:predicted phosphoribosyltransferase